MFVWLSACVCRVCFVLLYVSTLCFAILCVVISLFEINSFDFVQIIDLLNFPGCDGVCIEASVCDAYVG